MPMNNQYMARMANQQVLVAGDHAPWMQQCLTELSQTSRAIDAKLLTKDGMSERCEQAVDNDDGFWPSPDSWLSTYRPYVVVGGTLIIPVRGVLVHGLPYAIGDWATGYPYIRRAIDRGMADPDVQRVGFLVSSGGGEVAGNFDLVDRIFGYRGVKPMAAFVNEHAYSAAYSIASAADRIYVCRTGGVGSIGVVTMWVGMSKALEKAGYEIEFIYAGDHKVDGNPYEALPKDVKARTQKRIDSLYDIFTATVARNLGLEEQAIRDTKALTYGAEDAVRIGLAHEIRAYDDAMAAFSSAPNTNAGDKIVSKYTEEELQTQVTSARAEGKQAGIAEGKAAGILEGKAEGAKEGATAERARISAIVGSEEGKARPALAARLAFSTGMSAQEATETLAAVPAEPKAAASSQPNQFAAAMDSTLNPELGQEGGGEGDEKTAQANALVADYKAAAGIGSK